jgi:oligoendopeptidase F
MAKWNLNDIYDFKRTDKLVLQLKKEVSLFKKYRSILNKDLPIKRLLEIIRHKERIVVLARKLSSYSGLKLAENTQDSIFLAHDTKISKITSDCMNEMLFFNLWFKSLDKKTAENCRKNAKEYSYFLKTSYAFKPYMLKENEEKIINKKDLNGIDTVVNLYEIITNAFTFKWCGKEVTRDTLMVNMQSKNRRDRVNAYTLLLKRYEQEEATFSEIYRALINDMHEEDITLRGFKSPIGIRNLENEVSDKAVLALLNTVRKNRFLFQEYFRLKSRLLGFKMDRFDVYAPLFDEKKKYSFDFSKKIVLDTYSSFDSEFGKISKDIFLKNHVYSDRSKNKRGGAFCATATKDILPYILLNHEARLEDVYIMMHEFGHGIHSVLSKDNTEFTHMASLPLSETASIFGELLLSKKLLEKADDKERKKIILKSLDGYYATILRQAYFTLFEISAHKAFENNATADEINKIYYDNLKEQFGKTFHVPSIFKHEWKNIPHIYFSPFYCYSYTFGNLLVLCLYEMYENEGKEFIPKYKKILSYGGSKSPNDILKEIGVDIESEQFWQKGFEIIRKDVEELRRLV